LLGPILQRLQNNIAVPGVDLPELFGPSRLKASGGLHGQQSAVQTILQRQVSYWRHMAGAAFFAFNVSKSTLIHSTPMLQKI
jgi:hypothetical protein